MLEYCSKAGHPLTKNSSKMTSTASLVSCLRRLLILSTSQSLPPPNSCSG